MGKRKSSKKPQPKKAVALPLDKSFRCLFCQHSGTVSCKMDPKTHVARLSCRDCQQHFSVEYNHLTEPIDVYAAWIDACQAVNEQAGGSMNGPTGMNGRKRPVRDTAGQDSDDDEDDASEEERPAQRSRIEKRPAQSQSQSQNRRREEATDDEDEDLPDLAGADRRAQQKQRDEDALLEEDEDDEDAPAAQRRRVVADDDEEDDD